MVHYGEFTGTEEREQVLSGEEGHCANTAEFCGGGGKSQRFPKASNRQAQPSDICCRQVDGRSGFSRLQ